MLVRRIYNIDFNKQISLLLPTFKRKIKITSYLKALIKPLTELYKNLNSGESFLEFYKNTLYKLNHNGQVVYLQKVLNDRFDKDLRRIYITDGLFNTPTYVYPHIVEKDVYLNTQYIFSGTDLAFKDVDFVVVFPTDVNISDEVGIRIKSLINYYKLASKTYDIIQA
ncbi:hypothetical protein [Tenacibaculum sp. M341]|uniref:hypothetical protein n=1 Tax=Tenacibaculum sp. M341 TaxID=2530339 RepID=UPI001048A686|nr:hypothetical protein [Tenacibaculum sp. M341]TCI93694.1 hypothetical protein EYW44_04570 [Tenacibaculum sp. M341]